MKMNLLLGVALLTSFLTVAQIETYVSETGGENNPIVYVNQNFQLQPCSLTGPSNGFENGKSCTQNLGRIVANDLSVYEYDEWMLLEQLTLNLFIGEEGAGINAAFVDMYIWEDAGGAPDTESLVTSELGFIPTNQTLVGTNFGFDIWEVVLDITDVELTSSIGSGSDSFYWIGVSVEAADGSNVFWENSTAGIVNYGEAYDDGTGGGFVLDTALEGVYVFEGDCPPYLGVDDNLADRVKIYPNPATSKINIDAIASVEITGITLYDVLGKNTGANLTNGTIDVSKLARGVYILKINTTQGTLTKKVIKQ